MEKEELLKPRWKIIADYPFAPPIHAVGTIIEGTLAPDGTEPWENKYPHLFKPLAWHEERKVEDLPQYIKYLNHLQIYEVCKIDEYKTNDFGELFGLTKSSETGKLFIRNANAIPATEEEYNLNQPTPLNS